jgi:post-segregation antitoxin (ccd killing protein)
VKAHGKTERIRPHRSRSINLSVSMSDELYEQVKNYKATNRISLSAMVRNFMNTELEKFKAAESETKE